MEEVFVKDKQKFLDEQPPPFGGHKLTDKVSCLHCDEVITVGDYKIFKEEGDDFYTSAAQMLLNAMGQ